MLEIIEKKKENQKNKGERMREKEKEREGKRGKERALTMNCCMHIKSRHWRWKKAKGEKKRVCVRML